MVTDLFRNDGHVTEAFAHVQGHAVLDGVAAEPPPCARGEQRVPRGTPSFGRPCPQHRDGARQQWGAPFLSPFADAVDVSARADHQVAVVEPDELGDAQAAPGRQQEHGVVTPACPSALVAGSKQGCQFGLGQVAHEVALMTLWGDGEHSLDGGGVFGVAQGGLSSGGRYLQ
jgi:hypothetical protein